jgi:hypothetical protein
LGYTNGRVVLLALVTVGTGFAGWRFWRPRSRSTQIRKAKDMRGMIDIPLAKKARPDG